MSYRRLPVFILLGMTLLPFYASGQNGAIFNPANETYLWPTNAGHYLSSTFAETRARHFHAALDLKTWGQRGYEVYATRDGWLHRIAIGPNGYGKVIYLRHDDGSYSLYAHLLRFEDRIQHIADSLRMRNYSFELDQPLDSLRIRISQGDLIGLSGASGIGPPHLHFELRTPDDKPFNPLLTNLRVRDTIAPRFVRLSVEPLSMFSKIEGEHRIYTKRARQERDSSYTFSTVQVKGPVGLGVDVYDQADGVYNSYAVYELKMYVNDELFFHSKADSFSYSETDQMFLDRVYPVLRASRDAYQRLYIRDGNTLPFYRKGEHSGRLNLKDGSYRIRIWASDYYGNTSEARLNLQVRSPDTSLVPVPGPTSETGLPDVSPSNWMWYDNWVHIPKTATGGWTVVPLSSNTMLNVATNENGPYNVDLTKARDVFFRRSSRNHFIARRVFPDAFSIVPATTQDAFVTFAAGSVYDTLSVGIVTEVHRTDSVQIDVLPSSQPLRMPFKLAYKPGPETIAVPKTAIYAYSKRNGRLEFLATEHIGSHLIAYPEAFGTFFVLSDTLSPVVENPALVRRPDGHWIAAVSISDNLSGIDYHKSVFYVNGVRGIPEYEPEDDRLVYYHPAFTPKTVNTLKIVVYDRLGNKNKAAFRLEK